MKTAPSRTAVVLAVLHLSLLAAYGQSFRGLGDLPGSTYSSEANNVSADGRVVVGSSQSNRYGDFTTEAFRWEDGQMTGLGALPYEGSSKYSVATAASADGSVVVGSNRGTSEMGGASFRWENGVMTTLEVPLGRSGHLANDVNADGSIIVGRANNYGPGDRFSYAGYRWQQGTTTQLSTGQQFDIARGVSADGSVIALIGGAEEQGGDYRPYRWDSGAMQSLQMLAGYRQGIAERVSANGEFIVGHLFSFSGSVAVRWNRTGELLELTEGAAYDISADGKVVVGSYSHPNDTAFIWIENKGVRNLRELLVESGISLGGWKLVGARAISDNGRVIVGTGINPQGQREAWRAELPCDALAGSAASAMALAGTQAAVGSCDNIEVNITSDEADHDLEDKVCDVDPNEAGEQCSLRAAIETANAKAGDDKISFNIPGSGTHTIAPTSQLPAVTERVLINGATQPGYGETPLIEIQGSMAGANARGLVFAPGSNGSQVAALTINRFHRAGVEFQSNENTLARSYIGTGSDGSSTFPSTQGGQGSGIIISGARNVIGGATEAVTGGKNIISGNVGAGVLIEGADARGNVIDNSIIGSDEEGTAGLGNGGDGVSIINAPENVIGVGDASGQRIGNVISGNRGNGVRIEGATAKGNRVRGNRVGIKGLIDTVSQSLANAGHGVLIRNAAENFIGEFAASTEPVFAMANLIAGNVGAGVLIEGEASRGNVIGNSIIGTDKEGTAGLGNGGDGVSIINAPENVIGVGAGTGARVGNVISGNGGNGIRIEGATAKGNRVRGNRVGIKGLIDTVSQSLANAGHGVLIRNAAENFIGEFAASTEPVFAMANLIAGNVGAGVLIEGEASRGNVIDNSIIGTDEKGTLGLGNGGDGVSIIDAPENLVGVGGDSGARVGNIISGNAGNGIRIQGRTANRNRVFANILGLIKTDGTLAKVPNALNGIVVNAATNLIGNAAQFANIIAANQRAGVLIEGGESRGNIIENTIIGTDEEGAAGLGNGGDGVSIINAPENVIGLANDLMASVGNIGNTIAGNLGNGIRIEGAVANAVRGNRVGLFRSGNGTLSKLANSLNGILIKNAAGNQIGTGTGSQVGNSVRNTISGNLGAGVLIEGAESRGNVIDNSIIGTDEEGTAGLGNGGDGVSILNAPENVIGLVNDLAARVGNIGNTIAGNLGNGVRIENAVANAVRGNRVGLNRSGNGTLSRLANSLNGILIKNAAGNRIGTGTGSQAGNALRNTISGNLGAGVLIEGVDSRNNVISSSIIGTDESNTPGLGNDSHGILITDQAGLTTVGGPAEGSGNTIVNNGGAGVRVDETAGQGNLVDPNIIHNNAGLGIDIGPEGFTRNDPTDADAGPNNLQNYPQLAGAITGGDLIVNYQVDSAPGNASYGTSGIYVEFFEADASGEGRTFVGSDYYTANNYASGTPGIRQKNLGNAAALGVGAGDPLTATATDADGNSSEFTPAVVVTLTPSANPTPTPISTPTPSPSPSVSPSATPSATPGASPSPTTGPTPVATPALLQLLNISTRLNVQTGENVLIGGVIVTGNEPKKVIIRAIGPSLSEVFDGVLSDPALELYEGDTLLASNDNWRDIQQTEIEETTIPPSHDLESAIVYTLAPGSYTAVTSGQSGATGIGVIEVYDLDQAADSKLANIASRGFVEAGDNVMIGGLIVGGSGTEDARILIRAIGPSLGNAGIEGALQDPTLELRDSNGELVRENDDWQETQQSEIEATTIPPSDPAEAAILATLPSGNYTAIVRGKNDSTGVGLVEVYNLP